jgi:hypothetical protein
MATTPVLCTLRGRHRAASLLLFKVQAVRERFLSSLGTRRVALGTVRVAAHPLACARRCTASPLQTGPAVECRGPHPRFGPCQGSSPGTELRRPRVRRKREREPSRCWARGPSSIGEGSGRAPPLAALVEDGVRIEVGVLRVGERVAAAAAAAAAAADAGGRLTGRPPLARAARASIEQMPLTRYWTLRTRHGTRECGR